ncbi:MAG: zinc-binding dehydrogenase [Enterococcus faecalis]
MEKIIRTKHDQHLFKFESINNPIPQENELVIDVKAFSLNPGDVSNALSETAGFTPGWDFSGVVIDSGSLNHQSLIGKKIVGIKPDFGTWRNRLVISHHKVAVIPDTLDFIEATTLPIPGLTALYAVQKGGALLNKNVLITASNGAVGQFAHQLVRLAGGNQYGMIRNLSSEKSVKSLGALEVYQEEDLKNDFLNDRFDLIIDSVGGDYLNFLLPALKNEGTLISVGNSRSNSVTIDYTKLLEKNNISFKRFFLGEEIKKKDIPSDLSYLSYLLNQGLLRTNVAVVDSWKNINHVIHKFELGHQSGKVVLTTN